MSHIEGQVRLKRHLYIFRIFDEEAEGEDEREAEAEEEAGAHLFSMSAVEIPSHEEEEEVGDGLIQLPRMSRFGGIGRASL